MAHTRKLTYRAGMIPYVVENNEIYMMFMRPSNPDFGGDTYQIAKGKLEEGETSSEAALREAKEEIGLFTGNMLKTERVGEFMGRTTIYVTKIKDKDMFGEPTFETESVRWMTLEQFLECGRVLHQPVVQAAYRKILRMEAQEQ